MSKQEKQKEAKEITISLPAEIADAALASFARMQRTRVRSLAQQQNRTVDDSVDKTSDEEVVTTSIRSMILSAYEREVTQETIKKLREKY